MCVLYVNCVCVCEKERQAEKEEGGRREIERKRETETDRQTAAHGQREMREADGKYRLRQRTKRLRGKRRETEATNNFLLQFMITNDTLQVPNNTIHAI